MSTISSTAPATDARTHATVVSVTIPGHGLFAASVEALDETMTRFLPASPAQLRAVVQERCGFDHGEYDDVTSVSALLVVLASTSGIDERVYGHSFP